MSIWTRVLRRSPPRLTPQEEAQLITASARNLALMGVAKRKANVRETARQIRRELGLPPHKGLEA